MGEAQLISFPSDDHLAAAVAAQWLAAITTAQQAGRKHLVALSGGRVTKKMFASAAARSRQNRMTFSGVEFFWADERCVPPTEAESNFRLADENLFRLAGVGPQQVHRIMGEWPPAQAAAHATTELEQMAGAAPGAMPVLDLVLLGMGEDGHVASLFPGDADPAQNREAVFLAVANSPKPPPHRVSLGYGAIAAAREVWVLASGAGKEKALRRSLALDRRTPLALVIKDRAATKIFTDIPTPWTTAVRIRM
jgi:6-phosphogluconolactonase